MVVYDITNSTSFNDLSYWLQQINGYVNEETCILIVGNKLDLKEQRTVSVEKVRNLVRVKKAQYVEVSALTS